VVSSIAGWILELNVDLKRTSLYSVFILSKLKGNLTAPSSMAYALSDLLVENKLVLRLDLSFEKNRGIVVILLSLS
jgi:uncharacterized protein (DUF1810 family)